MTYSQIRGHRNAEEIPGQKDDRLLQSLQELKDDFLVALILLDPIGLEEGVRQHLAVVGQVVAERAERRRLQHDAAHEGYGGDARAEVGEYRNIDEGEAHNQAHHHELYENRAAHQGAQIVAVAGGRVGESI